MKTPFEQALEQAQSGILIPPKVSSSDGNIDYFGYQLAVHKYHLQIMAKGMKCRGVILKDIKIYYGLKGRTASDCLLQFIELFNKYKSLFKPTNR